MKKMLTAILLGCTFWVNAQVKISAIASSAHPSAMLDIESNDKGLLLPRLASNKMQAIVSPATGLMVFNTTDTALYVFADTGWAKINSGNQPWLQQHLHVYTPTGIKVGIGTASPAYTLQVAGNLGLDSSLYLPNSTAPGVGVIYKDGLPFLHNAGLMVQQNVYLGTNAGSFYPLAKKNVAVGSYALANSDGADNIAIGYSAGRSLTGGSAYSESYKNLFVGYLCGENATGGINNISIGNEAGYNLKAGSVGNVVIGSDAGKGVTTGIGNVLIGNNVQTINGLLNTGVGANSGIKMAGGSYNSWFGTDALKNNKSGQYNLVMGAQSAVNDSVGSFNVYLGAFTATNTQGSNNVFIGAFAGNTDVANLSNKFIINNTNNQQHLINGDFYLDRVGINKTFADLQYTLDIGGEIRIGSLAAAPTAANGVMYYNSTDQKLKTYENGNWKNTVYDNAMKVKAGDPVAADLPTGNFHVWKNSNTGNVYLWVNDGGVMKKVQLQ